MRPAFPAAILRCGTSRWWLATALVSALLMGASLARAQLAGLTDSPTAAPSVRNLRLTAHPLGRDHIESDVRSIVQDSDGFLWVGTADGLFRLSGNDTQAYFHTRTDSDSLRDNRVVDLALDPAGALWIATRTGIHRYSSERETLQRDPVMDRSELRDVRISAMTITSDGTLWLGTSHSGAFSFSPADGTLHAYQTAPEDRLQMPAGPITDLLEDSHGNLWLASEAGGFARFDRRTERFIRYDRDSSSLTTNHVTRLYEDSQGTLWIGTRGQGVFRFDPALQTFGHMPIIIEDDDSQSERASNEVRDLLVDEAGTLWIATADGLREWMAPGQFVHHRSHPGDPGTLSDSAVNRLYQDRDGVLWIGSERGVDRWNYLSAAFSYLGNDQAPGGAGTGSGALRATAVAECADGTLWLGTRNRGLARYAPTEGRLHFLDNRARKVRTLLCDEQGHLWIGTVDQGLLMRRADDTATTPLRTVLRAAPRSLPQSEATSTAGREPTALQVIRLASTGDGHLWAGTIDHGLFHIEYRGEGAAPVISQYPGPTSSDDPGTGLALPHRSVRALFTDRSGTLWIGTGDGQLSEYLPDSQAFRSYPLASDRGQRTAVDLLQDKQGDLWIATAGDGLLRWPRELLEVRTPTFTQINRAAGLPSDYLRCLLEDQQGLLWLSSNRGLIRFDPATLKVRRFDRGSGLRGDRFYYGAKLASRNGQLFFGSAQGLLGFYPSSIELPEERPALTVAAHDYDGMLTRSYSADDDAAALTLAAGSPYVRFEFDALRFMAPEQQRFRYQLEGFDREWHLADRSQSATYTSLPAGRYLFRVQSAGPDEQWRTPGGRIELTVARPLWQSVPAYLLYACAVLALLAYLLLSWRRALYGLQQSRRNLEIQVEHRTTELEERNRQLQQLNLKLQEASITDPLTGLLNRRSFY
ncbi:MAG: two-component regulator propeller domain-containing protein, partial [Pseudomonadota bacterium]